MVLIGNKSDLINEREVSTYEALEMSKKFGCSYFETSAKYGTNIHEAFEGIVKSVQREEDMMNTVKKVNRKKVKGCQIL